ncbi:YqiA/YcfP family alpha/beta fold hydrolase [Pseudoalteromonas sp. ESRF-bin5]|uniref:YqiA/YcfP family alpha/beta fold hydrolase n=1 Tax=Pseudoalteromonas sp. ESRF-bin5 TaxID=2014532 RepID=UPI00257F5D3D|nr:YqiA/YcfP family alpha/beta fold hydrolase [Pseudoalteromonas sp. ESRF-bin5]
MAKRVIYIHGFNSSDKSYKAVRFGELMAHYDVDYCVPCLNHEPIQAIIALEQLLTPNTVLLGSSLGGFFATYLSQRYQIPAVVINPAVAPYTLLKPLLGLNYNPYQDYHYELNSSHIAALKALAVDDLKHPELLYLLQQTGDEVLNFQHAVNYYSQCKQRIEFGGDHSYLGFELTFASIVDFLKIT